LHLQAGRRYLERGQWAPDRRRHPAAQSPDVDARQGRRARARALNHFPTEDGVMAAITIPLSEERMERLRALAEQAGVSPEGLARAGLEDWLRQPRDDFLRAARYVIQKNKELYRRLA